MCQTAFTKYQSNTSVLCKYYRSLGSHFKCAFFIVFSRFVHSLSVNVYVFSGTMLFCAIDNTYHGAIQLLSSVLFVHVQFIRRNIWTLTVVFREICVLLLVTYFCNILPFQQDMLCVIHVVECL